jgi:tetratricopeptide (TPR) repeat protein
VTGAGLRTLRKLLNKSLISTSRSDRYAIHELLRQFAEEKLETAGEAGDIREAHSRYYLDTLAQREADIKGRRQLEALKEIETDLDNVRAAWKWASERPSLKEDETSMGRALESLTWFYYMRSRNQEGVALFGPACQQLAAKGEPGRLLGRLLASINLLQAQFAERNLEMKSEAEASLVMAEAGGNQAEIAFAYLALGHLYSRQLADFEQAVTFFKESLERYRVLDDQFYMAHLLHRIGYSMSLVTGLEDFLDYTRQSLELAHQIGAKSDEANALGNLGTGSFSTGDYALAEHYFQEAITLSREMGYRLGESHSLVQLGLSHLVHGRLDQAQASAAAGLAVASELVSSVTQAYGLAVLSMRASLSGDYERGRQLGSESLSHSTNYFGDFLRQWALATAYCGLDQPEPAWLHILAGLSHSHRYRWPAVTTWLLPVISLALAQQGQSERAVEFLSLFLNHPLSATWWTENWTLLSEWQTRLEESLGSQAYQAAWQRGRALDLEQVTVELLR